MRPKIILAILFLQIFLSTDSIAQAGNILLGNVYEKSASSTNKSTLYFGSTSSGRSENTAEILGRESTTTLNFTYTLQGSRLTITYAQNLGTETYEVDAGATELVSTHLEGYVDGKWGKIRWRLKVGAGTPGRVEGSNYSFNQEKSSTNGNIAIGGQIWAGQNLSTSTFENGDAIPEARTKEEWAKYLNENEPAWCYYDNKPENGAKYGKLYNWYAVNDPRGLAPDGWSIPNKDDWSKLTAFLGGGSMYSREANAMKSRGEWAESAISNETNFSNTSGFSAVPAGYRNATGNFEGQKYAGVWWTADGSNIGMTYQSHSTSLMGFLPIQSGLSVRLIQNNSFRNNAEVVFVLLKENLKYQLTLLTDAKYTAYTKVYKDGALVNNQEGNWKIEQAAGTDDKLIFSTLRQTSGGYESSYGLVRYSWTCTYDESKNMRQVTNKDGVWYNQTPTGSGSKKRVVSNYVQTLGTPLKVGSLEVAQNDFAEAMSLKMAKRECAKLGNGWRVPTIEELRFLFKKKNNVLATFQTLHLSSTIDKSNGYTYIMDNDGNPWSYYLDTCFVRAVRGSFTPPTPEEELKEVIGDPIKIGDMEVAQNDISFLLDWADAQKACKELGAGWRVPTKKELNQLYKEKEKIGGFDTGFYWTASEYDGKDAKGYSNVYWKQNFTDGKQQMGYGRSSYLNIRPVRSVK